MQKKVIKFENIHIFLWLIKDLSWLMGFRLIGVLVMIPTLIFAGIIVLGSAKSKDQLPNLAVLFWIIANSWWMLVEFFAANENLRFYSLIPFAFGVVTITASFILNYFARQ